MKQPSQCDRVLEVLSDGQWHTIAEIHERAGTMRLNSRISELRQRRDLVIECSPAGPNSKYRLLGSLSDEADLTPVASSRDDGKQHDRTGGRLASSESETLFTFPRSPEWA